MKTIMHSELDSVLRKSEIHAMTCTIDHGPSIAFFNTQIEKGYLTIAVSSKQVKKAIRVFEIFLRRMYKEGFSLILDCNSHYHCPASAIVVDGEEIPVRLKEKRQLKSVMNGAWRYNEYVPTGILAMEIYGGIRWDASKVLMEKDDKKWKDVFEDIIPYLKGVANRKKAERIEAEEWYRKRQEQERIRKEHEQMIKDRALVVESIMHDVMLFEKAETIRRYCDLFERHVRSDEHKDRLATARQIADWLDPMNDYVDDLLAEKYKVEDFITLTSKK